MLLAGVIPGRVTEFPTDDVALPVPHMGWNGVKLTKPNEVFQVLENQHVYFVHSFHASPAENNADWVAATCNYGKDFVAAVNKYVSNVGAAKLTAFPQRSLASVAQFST